MLSEGKIIPLLSIITVCRNDAARLKRTIDSLSHFYNDSRFEHIVVDGESTDGTDSLVASLKCKANFKFCSGQDSGIYDAMNHGVSYSLAPLLLFLNCGDTIIATPSELSVCLGRLVACNDTVDQDITCFPVRQIGTKGAKNAVPTRLTNYKMPASHQGMVFARRFLQLNTYNNSYKIAGDFDLYLRATQIGISTDTFGMPFIAVEVDGVASANPLKAYGEYLKIVCNRLHGRSRIIALLIIAIRAILIISVKTLLPKRWLIVFRGV
jgi:glycosyltransferase involved in cell wall biosynthesis